MGFTSPLASASMALQAGGMVTSAIGNYYSAAAQKSSLKAQAGIADTNARIAELGAQSALNQGQQQAGAVSLNAGRLKSSQRVAMAANGIDLGVGNAAEIQASTDIMKEIDVATIEASAVRSAWGYRTQAVNYQNEAIMKRGAADGISPGGSAFSSLLGSAGGVAQSWYMFNKVAG